MYWIILVIGGFFEIGFATCLKFSDNFTKLWWSIGFIITSTLSFIFLNWAIKEIPLGTAYAVWTGIGAIGITIVGIYIFKDPVSFWRIFFLFLIIVGVIGLRVSAINR